MSYSASGNEASDLPANEIDPAILAELTRALLPYLGPYSITTVKRASRAARDSSEAIRMISQHIEDLAKRELFMKNAKRILSTFRPASATPSAQPSTTVGNQQNTGGRPATPITAELMRRGEDALAPIIGPLASVLVARYASASENSRDFFERLAGHLRTSDERNSFFLNIRSSGGATSAAH